MFEIKWGTNLRKQTLPERFEEKNEGNNNEIYDRRKIF